MSTNTLDQTFAKAPAEPLLSKRRKKFITDPLSAENPVTVQVLGICSSLAVTVKMQPTLVMSIAVVFVVAASNMVISMIRDLIPGRVRIIVQLAIVATLVTIVSELLKAYVYDMYKVLGAFVGLIITNCIVMGRLEAFAMANKAYDSVLDGLGSGFGYAWIILLVAFVRELFGSGTVFDIPIFHTISDWTGGAVHIQTNGLMVDSIGAFMVLGILIWVQRTKTGYVEQ